MNAQYRPLPYARVNSFHGPKRQLLGNQAGQVAPAWRVADSGVGQEQGSKILLSSLPADVSEKEVEELFKKTVGPIKEAFLIFNSQGKSKGMAVVAFHRSGDAALARAKYNGKFVDGRRPIKLEIVVDENSTNTTTRLPPSTSLFDRLQRTKQSVASTTTTNAAPAAIQQITPSTKHQSPQNANHAQSAPLPPRRVRHKKGPRRIKKKSMTREQLDQEMEDYRAAAYS